MPTSFSLPTKASIFGEPIFSASFLHSMAIRTGGPTTLLVISTSISRFLPPLGLEVHAALDPNVGAAVHFLHDLLDQPPFGHGRRLGLLASSFLALGWSLAHGSRSLAALFLVLILRTEVSYDASATTPWNFW